MKSILQNTNVIAPGMYKVYTNPNQTRTPQLPQDIRETNKCTSFFTGVISNTSVSRPQLKSNRLEDRVMHNNSEGKKQQVEDHRRNFKTKMPMVVPISTREPKRTVNQSVATPLKRTVASESTNQKPKSKIRKQYEQISETCKWWYSKITPPGYKWKPKTSTVNVTPNVSMPLGNKSRTTNILESITLRGSTLSNTPLSSISFAVHEIILFIVDSGCSKHMTGNLKLLSNFVEQFLGTVKFGNDQIAPILGYGDLVQGNVTIKRVYYVKGLNHNLFSVGQFCDADLEICIPSLFKTHPLPIQLAKASPSQAWLWHRRLSHLNFDTIKLLSKYDIVTGIPKLKFIKDHLCSSCELGKAKQSFNGKKYVLVIVDDYSRSTWTHFLRSKDETPEVLINFLKLVQRGLHAQLRTIRTHKGINFLNKTLHEYFAQEGTEHQTSTAQTPEQNGIVERRNRTLVEAARTMLSAAKVPLYFWDEAIATTCFTQNRSLVIPRHEKTPYHIINGRKPSVKFFYIFGSLCYIARDGENLDKLKEKGDACIFVGYSTQSRAYRVYNKRTRVIVETIHVNFDELPQMALDHTVTTSNELDLLFSSMFDELLNGTTTVVSKSSTVTATDVPNQHQQQNTTPSTSTIVAADIPPLNIQTTPKTTNQAPTVTVNEKNIQVETNKEHAQVDEDEFINIFCTPVQERGETSSRYVD
ncbi:retrovirus-related pol polyprotein from transposon TNT 1-94 [Tanacetum coccineum]